MKRFIFLFVLTNLFFVSKSQEVSELDLLGEWDVVDVEGQFDDNDLRYCYIYGDRKKPTFTFESTKCVMRNDGIVKKFEGYFISSNNILNLLDKNGIEAKLILDFDSDGILTLKHFTKNEYIKIIKNSSSTRVDTITSDDNEIEGIYNVKGEKINEFESGVNIINYSSGKSKKVIK